MYLCLLGTPGTPRTIRFDGPAARYMRPDDRSLANARQLAVRDRDALAHWPEPAAAIRGRRERLAHDGLSRLFR